MECRERVGSVRSGQLMDLQTNRWYEKELEIETLRDNVTALELSNHGARAAQQDEKQWNQLLSREVQVGKREVATLRKKIEGMSDKVLEAEKKIRDTDSDRIRVARSNQLLRKKASLQEVELNKMKKQNEHLSKLLREKALLHARTTAFEGNAQEAMQALAAEYVDEKKKTQLAVASSTKRVKIAEKYKSELEVRLNEANRRIAALETALERFENESRDTATTTAQSKSELKVALSQRDAVLANKQQLQKINDDLLKNCVEKDCIIVSLTKRLEEVTDDRREWQGCKMSTASISQEYPAENFL
eukprot:GHVU01088552.1.p1 GENE.GHVU01088552.1~~GHVU01088552.1.p1  ORF type:complete len:303 (-),score=53.80 GHVU01088552.1:12-920(-)